MSRDERISRDFRDIIRTFEEKSRTPLSVVVCGPGRPDQPDPTHPFHLREAIKNHLTCTMRDNAFYLEDLLTSEVIQGLQDEIEQRTSYRPDLKELEYQVLESERADKDVHLLENPGAILELRDFEDSPIICQKLKIFVDSCHKNDSSYIRSTLLKRVTEKGAKVIWYDDRDDLIRKVEKALIPNRIKKSFSH